MGPGVLGAGVTQLNLVISTALASLLPDGSVSYLYYADRLNQLPLGVVGIAVGTAILPPLSRQVRSGDAAGATATQNRGVELALLLTLPAAAALAILALPILAVLFQRGAFGPARGRGDGVGARRLCRRAAGLRPGQGAGAGLFRPPRHRDAGQGRGRRRWRVNLVLTAGADAVPRACRGGDRAVGRGLGAGADPAGAAGAARPFPARPRGRARNLPRIAAATLGMAAVLVGAARRCSAPALAGADVRAARARWPGWSPPASSRSRR